MQSNINMFKNLSIYQCIDCVGDNIMNGLHLLLSLISEFSVTQMQTLEKVQQLNVN